MAEGGNDYLDAALSQQFIEAQSEANSPNLVAETNSGEDSDPCAETENFFFTLHPEKSVLITPKPDYAIKVIYDASSFVSEHLGVTRSSSREYISELITLERAIAELQAHPALPDGTKSTILSELIPRFERQNERFSRSNRGVSYRDLSES